MTSSHHDPPAVVETRVVHDAHRLATSLLVTAPASAPADMIDEFREFVVAMLSHHHESEDSDLWPLLCAASPHLSEPLGRLSGEHSRLDAALDELAESASPESAVVVRDLLHEHLAHEEPVLFPVLRTDLAADAWEGFSERTVASAPQNGKHLFVGLFHEVASPAEVDLVLRHLPPEAKALVPAMLAQAEPTLDVLRGAAR